MTFLSPGYLAAAGGLAVVVVALHFIVTREPATLPLPTARFAPDRAVRARSRALTLSDLLLLLCRTALVLAAGAALAQPIAEPSRRPLARLILVDRSGSPASPAEVDDSARSLRTGGDALIGFDSSAVTGSLSAALIHALRSAVSMRDVADSLELAIVSPFTEDQLDQASDSIRALWPGAIRLVRVAPRRDTLPPPAVSLLGAADDPLRFALTPAPEAAEAEVRIVRGTPGAADSAWVEAGRRALVVWPVAGDAGSDTVGAVMAGSVVVVAPFPRGAVRLPAEGRVVARWVDGVPAAIEVARGAGCIRAVAIPVPSIGDLVLDPRFQRLASRLTGRCGAVRSSQPLSESRLAALSGGARPARVASSALGRARVVGSPLTPWLLGVALLFGVGELVLRRRPSESRAVSR